MNDDPLKISTRRLNKIKMAELSALTDAKDSGDIGFMERGLILAAMPHRQPIAPLDRQYVKRFENYVLAITAMNPDVLVPYGSLARLLLAWICKEAVQNKQPTISLGGSQTDFMEKLGLEVRGGVRGNVAPFRDQAKRLFNAGIFVGFKTEEEQVIRSASHRFMVTEDDVNLDWWNSPKGQKGLWEPQITLGKNFFEEIIANPVPIDMRTLRLLTPSPMAMDLYMWLTYKMHHLSKPTTHSWERLQLQFGENYKRLCDFKPAFTVALKNVAMTYSPRVELDAKQGLIMKPSRPHIAPTNVEKAVDNPVDSQK
jgi:hypothetical protein